MAATVFPSFSNACPVAGVCDCAWGSCGTVSARKRSLGVMPLRFAVIFVVDGVNFVESEREQHHHLWEP
jgi:hypothetical protein